MMNCTGNYRNLGQDPWEAFCLIFEFCVYHLRACLLDFGDDSHGRATPDWPTLFGWMGFLIRP